MQSLSIERVRPWLPPALSVVPVAPGRTLGGLFIASYGASSTLQYHELVVVAALVRHGGRVGGWVSHIYVDDPQSRAGGHAIWGLPKELAHFDVDSDASPPVQARQGSSVLCRFAPGRGRALPRLPVFIPVLNRRGGATLWFHANGWARYRIGRSEVDVPRESPFFGLGFHRGWRVALADLDMRIGPP